MFEVHPSAIEGLRGPGGDRFAAFVNDLLRAHSRAMGITATDVRTNLATTVPDGGVDAEIVSGCPNDPRHILIVPSVWQYKATSAKAAGPAVLAAELRKPYASEKIRSGAAFFVCVAHSLTPNRIQEREDVLKATSAEINSLAPAPRVLDANLLASLAMDYPSVIVRHFHPDLTGHFLSLPQWRLNVQRETAEYHWTTSSSRTCERIVRHLDFTVPTEYPVLAIVGGRGSGKSRLIYESIAGIDQVAALTVIATNANDARQIAQAVFENDKRAFLVVDGPLLLEEFEDLRRMCRGNEQHVRMIVSVNTSMVRNLSEAICEPIQVFVQDVEAILAKNFPDIPGSRLRAYAHLSGPLVGLAIAFCHSGSSTGASEIPDETFAREAVSSLVGGDPAMVAAFRGLAILDAVGRRDHARGDLLGLCDILDLKVALVQQFVLDIGSPTSLIMERGDYWIVQPPAIARLAFVDGWDQWVRHDIAGFIQMLDQKDLTIPFLRQVAAVGPIHVRTEVARTLSPRFTERVSDEIWNGAMLEEMLLLCEIEPGRFLPLLEEKLDAAVSDLIARGGMGGYHGPQYQAYLETVRVLSRLASHRDTFPNVISALIRLLPLDGDERRQPTAHGTLVRLFQIWLSGTPLPFMTRFESLLPLLETDDLRIGDMAADALCNALDSRQFRGVGQPIVGAIIPEREWAPETYRILNRSFDLILSGLSTLIERGPVEVRHKVWSKLSSDLNLIRHSVPLSRLNPLFRPDVLPDATRHTLMRELREILDSLRQIESDSERQRYLNGDTEDDVRAFLNSLIRDTTADRLAFLLSASWWMGVDTTNKWNGDARSLAQELLKDPDAGALVLLDAPVAIAEVEFQLGKTLGEIDEDARLFAGIMELVRLHPERRLATGYLNQINVRINATQRAELNDAIADLTAGDPENAFDLIRFATPEAGQAGRLISLIGPDQVSPIALRVLRGRTLTMDEFVVVLDLLISASEAGNANCAKLAMEFLDEQSPVGNGRPIDLIADEGLFMLVVRLLRSSIETDGYLCDVWSDLLLAVTLVDRAAAIEIACQGLLSWEDSTRDASERVLIAILPGADIQVMQALSEVMINENGTLDYGFHRRCHGSLFAALPSETVLAWLETAGTIGLVALAPHLPQPYVAVDGTAVVPPLTDRFLRLYNNPDVIRGFAASTVSPDRFTFGIGSEEEEQRAALRERVDAFTESGNPGIRAWRLRVRAQLDELDKVERSNDIWVENTILRGNRPY